MIARCKVGRLYAFPVYEEFVGPSITVVGLRVETDVLPLVVAKFVLGRGELVVLKGVLVLQLTALDGNSPVLLFLIVMKSADREQSPTAMGFRPLRHREFGVHLKSVDDDEIVFSIEP